MKNLEDMIDWPGALAQPRYAGGHEEVMRSIFGPASAVIAWWSDNDYQGTIAIAHQINEDGRVVVMTDYYGSCSGCDSWEDSSEEDARRMIHDLVQHAKVFPTRAEAAAWCADVNAIAKPHEYPFTSAINLVKQLRG